MKKTNDNNEPQVFSNIVEPKFEQPSENVGVSEEELAKSVSEITRADSSTDEEEVKTETVSDTKAIPDLKKAEKKKIEDTQEIPQLHLEDTDPDTPLSNQSEQEQVAAKKSAQAQADAIATAAARLTGEPEKKKKAKQDEPEKKKLHPALRFFIGLLKALVFLGVMFAVGFASYKVSYHYLAQEQKKAAEKAVVEEIEEIKKEAQTEEISQNLIYVVDDKNKITHLMLEICNTKTYNMDYLTIPTKIEYTIPTSMFQKLLTVNQEIPQIVRIDKMLQYFSSEDDGYGYGQLIVEKMIGADISYYTVLNTETYNSWCEQVKVKVNYTPYVLPEASESPSPSPDDEGGEPTATPKVKKQNTKMNISIASDIYIKELQALGDDQKKIMDFIESQYERIESNLTVDNKIGYMDCYVKQDPTLYRYWGVPGFYQGKMFVVDRKATKKLIKAIVENTVTYTMPQDLTKTQKISMVGVDEAAPVISATPSPTATPKDEVKKESSKGKQILILNGSRVSGVAGRLKEKLEKKGFTVAEIGDYDQEVLEKSKIIVKKEGQGLDLKKYLKKPKVIVGMVEDGYDIEIIVGTNDAE